MVPPVNGSEMGSKQFHDGSALSLRATTVCYNSIFLPVTDRFVTHQPNSIALIGVGLMGGSIGLAAQSRRTCEQVIGIGRDLDRLSVATEFGAITAATTDLAVGVRDVDLVVICTPSATVADIAREVYKSARPDVIITDVASTKLQIIQDLQPDIQAGMRYVGSHPLCGSHLTGVEAADPNLFRHQKIIVTPALPRPLATEAKDIVREVVFFWKALSGVPVEMSAEEHDRALAATSHVPHIVASALAGATPFEMLSLVSSGWRDSTRVAAGSVEIWRDILHQNRAMVIDSLRSFSAVVDEFQVALEEENWDQIIKLLEHGKKQRDAVGN